MQVVHQPDQDRFAVLQDGEDAVLEYRRIGDTKVDFARTFVPESMRGKGVAGLLVAEGMRWARSEGLEIDASCSYVQKWLAQENT